MSYPYLNPEFLLLRYLLAPWWQPEGFGILSQLADEYGFWALFFAVVGASWVSVSGSAVLAWVGTIDGVGLGMQILLFKSERVVTSPKKMDEFRSRIGNHEHN